MISHPSEPNTPNEPSGTLHTKAQTAAFLKVTEHTVENLQRRGLPFYRLGARRNRLDLVAVKAWLDSTCRIVRVD